MCLAVALVLWMGVAMASEHEPAPASSFGRTGPSRLIPPTARFDQEIANGNSIAMTLTNYGFYGNNFFKRDASFEYPAGRGYEHMVRGGLWIGAQATDTLGEFIGVTCGTVDAAQGPNSTEASEWTPSGLDILKRSTLKNNQYYDSLRAVSELDFVSDFNDFSPAQVSGSERHRPMGLEVHQETYQWSYAEYANILFVHLVLKNRGPLLKNAWVGFYTEMASGCKKCYVNWPPSASDPGGMGGYFSKKWIVFDEPLNLMREHYCAGVPPDGCNLGVAPYWAGLRYLGSKGLAEDTTTRKVSFSTWKWTLGSPFRDEDTERYGLMSTGVIQPVAGDSVMPVTGDPVELVSVGPFPLIYRDSTIAVDFAFVAGVEDVADIRYNSVIAKGAYDQDYVLAVPPPSPRFEVVARDAALDFYWDNESESAYDTTTSPLLPQDARGYRPFEGYRLYIGEDPDSMAMVAQFDAAGDTASFNTGFDAVALPGPTLVDTLQARYKFTVGGLKNGFKYYCAVTAFDLGSSVMHPLESGRIQNQLIAVPGPRAGERPNLNPTVYPNPYRVEARWDQGKNVRDHYLWFANLPVRCTIRIYTLAGDLLYVREHDGGDHGHSTQNARGIWDRSSGAGEPTTSGRDWGWDLITRQGQAIASGLYLYSVEDHAAGNKRYVGKFLVIKSDREGQ
jgi:hypothetical protein